MNGRISGSISTTSTWLPNAANRDANSTPITPPPITTSRCGTALTASRPVESTTSGLSFAPGIGGITGTEPVAMITWSAVLWTPSTSTAPGPTRVPWPKTTSTWFRFSVDATPATSLVTTSAFQAWTFAQSKVTFSAVTPNCSLCSAWLYSFAEFSSDLVGMQPTFRQVPPRNSFSTSSTRFFACPSRSAAR